MPTLKLFIISTTLILSTISHASFKITPFLYKVTKGNSESYLFGTMHGGVSLADLPSIVVSKLKSAESIAVEVIFDQKMVNYYFYDLMNFNLNYFNFQGEILSLEDSNALINKRGLDPKIALSARSKDCSLIT